MTPATEAETGESCSNTYNQTFPSHFSLSLFLYLYGIVRMCLTDDSLTHRHLVNGRHHLSEVTNHLGHGHKNMKFELTKTFSSTGMIMLITCSCFSN